MTPCGHCKRDLVPSALTADKSTLAGAVSFRISTAAGDLDVCSTCWRDEFGSPSTGKARR